MPRAHSYLPKYGEQQAARERANGTVRGPRITAEAAESLRVLAYRHRLNPSEVVSRLLTGVPLEAARGTVALSPAELRAWSEMEAADAAP